MDNKDTFIWTDNLIEEFALAYSVDENYKYLRVENAREKFKESKKEQPVKEETNKSIFEKAIETFTSPEFLDRLKKIVAEENSLNSEKIPKVIAHCSGCGDNPKMPCYNRNCSIYGKTYSDGTKNYNLK